MQEQTWRYALWRQMLHVVNRSTYLRGPLTTMLRQVKAQVVTHSVESPADDILIARVERGSIPVRSLAPGCADALEECGEPWIASNGIHGRIDAQEVKPGLVFHPRSFEPRERLVVQPCLDAEQREFHR